MFYSRDSVNEAYFNIEKLEKGIKLPTKKTFFEILEGRH